MAYCTKCGKPNPDIAKFCTSCGATFGAAVSAPASKKSAGKMWMTIAIGAILAVCAISYFLFFNKKKNEEVKTEIPKEGKGLYPNASDHLLTGDEISNMSQQELRIMRNEIYARHGFIFQKEDMKQYFSSQTWYKPLYTSVNNLLTEIEKKNIFLIKRYEKFQEDDGSEYGR